MDSADREEGPWPDGARSLRAVVPEPAGPTRRRWSEHLLSPIADLMDLGAEVSAALVTAAVGGLDATLADRFVPARSLELVTGRDSPTTRPAGRVLRPGHVADPMGGPFR